MGQTENRGSKSVLYAKNAPTARRVFGYFGPAIVGPLPHFFVG